MCRFPLFAFRVENTLHAKFELSRRADDFHRLAEIESVLDLELGKSTLAVVRSNNPEVFFLLDLAVFLEPYPLLARIPDEESRSVSTIGDREELLGELVRIVVLPCLDCVECCTICTSDSGDIVHRLRSSFYFE